jgi:hypothetical protein
MNFKDYLTEKTRQDLIHTALQWTARCLGESESYIADKTRLLITDEKKVTESIDLTQMDNKEICRNADITLSILKKYIPSNKVLNDFHEQVKKKIL